jgi:hypothetical protein
LRQPPANRDQDRTQPPQDGGAGRTALEAARALGGKRESRYLRRYLVGQIVDYLDRCTRYTNAGECEAFVAWRNATPEEQDAAAEELLKGLI